MAIARDTSSQINSAGTYSDWNPTGTWAHTCTGTNRILIVGIETQPASGHTFEILTGVTYNGKPMTQLLKRQRADGAQVWHYLYYILESDMPASGVSANIVATASERSDFSYGGAVSYTGVAQSAPEASGAVDSSSGTATVTLTTVADNAWLVGLGYNSGGATITAGANTVNFNSILAWGHLFDTNAAQTPAGLHSMNYSFSGGTGSNGVFLAASIAPFVAPPLVTARLSLLGVG